MSTLQGNLLYLPGSVEDVEETRLRVDDRALLIGVLDRRVVVVDEVVLHILQGERRFAHTPVTKHHYSIPRGVLECKIFRFMMMIVVLFDKDDDDDDDHDHDDGKTS